VGNLGGDLGGGGAARGGVSLGSLTAAGKYVVLCFVPENSMRNGAELTQFEKRRREFDELDAVVVGCSSSSDAWVALLAPPPGGDPARASLSFPLLASSELVQAYGARTPIGGTARQTFIIDPTGQVRYIERNIELGVGEFSLENHAKLTLRALYQVHNTDGWSI